MKFIIMSLIQFYSMTYGVDANYSIAIAKTESNLKTDTITYEPKVNGYSYGLFQVRYITAKDLGYNGSKKDLLDVDINIKYGIKHIKRCMDKYGEDLNKVSCCYNAGLYRKAKVCKSDQVKLYQSKVQGYMK